MFGWGRRKRGKKDSAIGDIAFGGADFGDLSDGCGCGCDLPLIAFTVMAGASLLYPVR